MIPDEIRGVTVATVVGVLLLPVALAWALPLLSELLSLGAVLGRRRRAWRAVRYAEMPPIVSGF